MSEYLLMMVIISLACNGIDLITSEGYIFHFVRVGLTRLAERSKAARFLYDPLIGCIVCMSSIWGSTFYWLFQWIWPTDHALIMWPLVILAVAPLNTIISNLIDWE